MFVDPAAIFQCCVDAAIILIGPYLPVFCL